MIAVTIDDFLDWMGKQGYSKETIKSYKTDLYGYWHYFLPWIPEISDGSVMEYIDQKYTNIGTRNKSIAHFSAFVSWIHKRKIIGVVGDFSLRQKRPQIDIPRIISETEFLTWVIHIRDIRARHLAYILWYTGMRFSEARRLTQNAYYEPLPGSPGLKV